MRPNSLATLVAVCALAPVLRGELLPIVNPSFEDVSRPLLVGEQTNGAGGAGVPVATRFPFAGGGVSWDNPVMVPGWRTTLRPPGDTAINYAGILNPPERAPGRPFVAGQDGQNVAAVQVSRMGQTLNVLLSANTRYELSFLGGIGLFDSDYFLNASLIAVDDLERLPLVGQPGVAHLANSQGAIPPRDSFGTMLPYSFAYTTPAILPPELAGRYIGVHVSGSDGIPRVLYDSFRLEATPVPEASSGLLTGGMALLLLRLRR
jgi:hypothetical protein